MHRWVYWASLAFIALVLAFPAIHLLTDPQAELRDLFRLGIDLEGGTSLIYELRAAEGAGEAPDAAAAKQVIMGRIDPQGTRGYIVRAVGKHRLEIVLPGRSKVTVTPAAPTQENLQDATKRALKQQNPVIADLIKEKLDAFLGGTRLVVRMSPAMFLEDIQTRLVQESRERMPDVASNIAVVGLEASGDQWNEIAVLVTLPATDAKRVGDWQNLVRSSLQAQRDVGRAEVEAEAAVDAAADVLRARAVEAGRSGSARRRRRGVRHEPTASPGSGRGSGCRAGRTAPSGGA
jgi:hypothetical protein